MQTVTPCPLIEVSGTPRERGRQYGEQARARVRLGIGHYTEQMGSHDLTWSQVSDLAIRFEPMIAAFELDYVEEMKGIAEGAGVDYAGVVLLNARTEVLKLGEREKGKGIDDGPSDGCTGVLALPGATRDGRLLHAQNWDWKYECAETAVVLKVLRDDGPDVLTFTEAGGLARHGMNAAGISLTANYLESDRDYRNLGVPLPFIRRKALEQSSAQAAMRLIYAVPKSCANNMMVAHCEGVAIDFECAPDETFMVFPRDGLMVHANHFQSPVALSKLVEKGVPNMPDSIYRDLRVDALVRPHLGRITRETLAMGLFDDFGSPWAVCRPPSPSRLTGNLSATVATIIMEPETGWMGVAMVPALNQTFQSYRLTPDIQKSNATPRVPVFL